MIAALPPLGPWATVLVVACCAFAGAVLGDLAMRLHRSTDKFEVKA